MLQNAALSVLRLAQKKGELTTQTAEDFLHQPEKH